MTLSSWSTTALEDVAAAAPGGYRWFQLYVYKDRDVTLDLVRRAERAGYKALAVTVDTPCLGRREADIKNRFALPSHLTMGNFAKAGGSFVDGTKKSGQYIQHPLLPPPPLIPNSIHHTDYYRLYWLRSGELCG